MAEVNPPPTGGGEEEPPSIHSLSVEGYKSIGEERTIELRPLTILAGANSSGKSSAIQPLLLLKQTLEAPYDPGPLLLNGPNVKFTSVSQMVSSTRPRPGGDVTFVFGASTSAHDGYKVYFKKGSNRPIELGQMEVLNNWPYHILKQETIILSNIDLLIFNKAGYYSSFELLQYYRNQDPAASLRTTRERCFFAQYLTGTGSYTWRDHAFFRPHALESAILNTIHVPGLRGNPKRNYPVAAVGDRFPGVFEDYVASVIVAAERNHDQAFLDKLRSDLVELGLTSKIQARSVDDTQVELHVGRLPTSSKSGADDLVSIADVGFGVSQTIPVVVALLTAKPGQLVYIEQPELHLHPRAQHAMAVLLARAATRGVKVVIETHSSILLLGIQSQVVSGTLDPARVKLHWFTRDEQTGMTNIASADLDEAGRFGDWPEDFDNVTLDAQQKYLDAAEKKLAP
jgi:predicted ATPase